MGVLTVVSVVFLLAGDVLGVFRPPPGQCLESVESLQFGWSLHNFSRRAERHDVPRRIHSPYFPLNPLSDTTWFIHIFPPGDSADLRDSMGLYVTLASTASTKELARFSYAILDKNFRRGGSKGSLKGQSPVVNLTPYALWGWPRAAKREQVNLGHLTHDILHLLIKVDRLALVPSNVSSCVIRPPQQIGRNPFDSLEWCETFYQEEDTISFSWTFDSIPADSQSPISMDFPNGDDSLWYIRLDNSNGDINLFLCLRQQGRSGQPLATFNATLVRPDKAYSAPPLVRTMTLLRKFGEESNVGQNVYPCWGWYPLETAENFQNQFGATGVTVSFDVATYQQVSRCSNTIPVVQPL